MPFRARRTELRKMHTCISTQTSRYHHDGIRYCNFVRTTVVGDMLHVISVAPSRLDELHLRRPGHMCRQSQMSSRPVELGNRSYNAGQELPDTGSKQLTCNLSCCTTPSTSCCTQLASPSAFFLAMYCSHTTPFTGLACNMLPQVVTNCKSQSSCRFKLYTIQHGMIWHGKAWQEGNAPQAHAQ